MSLQEDVRTLAVDQAVMNTRLKDMDDKLDTVVKGLSGTYKSPGLVTRVDRLEQTNRLSRKFVWLIVAAIIAAVTSVAVTAVAGG